MRYLAVVGGASLGASLGAMPPARADDTALYHAYEIVTGTDMRQRPWGFTRCLREVLVKVAGDPRLRDDPRVAALGEHADGFVTHFAYTDMMASIPRKDDQGSYDRPHRLDVNFDPSKIDAAVTALGDRPWHGARPVIVPVMLVLGPKPPAYLLSAEESRGADQRGSLRNAAEEFGLTVRFPSASELAAWHIDVAKPEVPPTIPVGAENQGEMVVAGTLAWDETRPGWAGTWSATWRGATHTWTIAGVNYDAAFRNIIGGAELLASNNGAP